MREKFLVFLWVILSASISLSHEDSHSEANGRFGNDKAITNVESHKGFKLSPEAEKSLGIKVQAIDKNNIPPSVIVLIKDRVGVYVQRQGFYQFIDLKTETIFQAEDKLVVEGLGFITITDVYSKDESEYGH